MTSPATAIAEPDVVVVGAGLAGLCCARRLTQTRTPFLLLEASDAVGGRVRTDLVDGFLLDRGFQIFLTSYPEARRVLDYGPLKLKPFYRGAWVRYAGRFHRLADPRKHPLTALRSLASPIGTVRDKLRLVDLLRRVLSGSIADQWQSRERLTLDFLRLDCGFSDAMIERFFRPFFGGVFLESSLHTSSRMFRFVLRMFALGQAVVPASGMGAIPEQIAARLPADSLRLNTPVERVEPGRVYLTTGETIACRAVVVATEEPVAARLLGESVVPAPPANGVTCVYFAANASPVAEPVLLLDGEGRGPVNNLVVMSNAAPSYAPPGQALISASILGLPPCSDAELVQRIQAQLTEWFGSTVQSWRHLRTYRIAHALPARPAGTLVQPQRPVRITPGLYVCGDHRDNPSIDGAMTSGFRAAQALLADMDARLI